MIKPKQKTFKYYEWGDVEMWMIENKIWSELYATEFRGYLTDILVITNGKPFTIGDWELKHNNGEFAFMVPDTFRLAIQDLMIHFGTPDKDTLTPGVLTATFIETW